MSKKTKNLLIGLSTYWLVLFLLFLSIDIISGNFGCDFVLVIISSAFVFTVLLSFFAEGVDE